MVMMIIKMRKFNIGFLVSLHLICHESVSRPGFRVRYRHHDGGARTFPFFADCIRNVLRAAGGSAFWVRGGQHGGTGTVDGLRGHDVAQQ